MVKTIQVGDSSRDYAKALSPIASSPLEYTIEQVRGSVKVCFEHFRTFIPQCIDACMQTSFIATLREGGNSLCSFRFGLGSFFGSYGFIKLSEESHSADPIPPV